MLRTMLYSVSREMLFGAIVVFLVAMVTCTNYLCMQIALFMLIFVINLGNIIGLWHLFDGN